MGVTAISENAMQASSGRALPSPLPPRTPPSSGIHDIFIERYIHAFTNSRTARARQSQSAPTREVFGERSH